MIRPHFTAGITPSIRMALVRSFAEQYGIRFAEALRIFNRLDRELSVGTPQEQFEERYRDAVAAEGMGKTCP